MTWVWGPIDESGPQEGPQELVATRVGQEVLRNELDSTSGPGKSSNQEMLCGLSGLVPIYLHSSIRIRHRYKPAPNMRPACVCSTFARPQPRSKRHV